MIVSLALYFLNNLSVFFQAHVSLSFGTIFQIYIALLGLFVNQTF